MSASRFSPWSQPWTLFVLYHVGTTLPTLWTFCWSLW